MNESHTLPTILMSIFDCMFWQLQRTTQMWCELDFNLLFLLLVLLLCLLMSRKCWSVRFVDVNVIGFYGWIRFETVPFQNTVKLRFIPNFLNDDIRDTTSWTKFFIYFEILVPGCLLMTTILGPVCSLSFSLLSACTYLSASFLPLFTRITVSIWR